MIINDIDTLKAIIPTIVGDNFDIFKTHLGNANDWLRDEITGRELFNRIDQAQEADKELLKLCERLVAFHAYERAIPFLDLVQTDNGFAVESTENLAPASRERVNALLTAARTEQDNAIEALQAFLEANNGYHEQWQGSPAYSLLTDTFIHTLKVFRCYVSLSIENKDVYPKSRRDFTALHGTMREAMAFRIAPVISAELMVELIKQLRDGALSDANKRLLEPLRFALANFAMGQDSKADVYLRNALAILAMYPDDYPAWRDSAEGKAFLSKSPAANDQPIFFGGF